MAEYYDHDFVHSLALKVARLEAELEIVKCRQAITDLRIDGLVAATTYVPPSVFAGSQARDKPVPPPRPPLPDCMLEAPRRRRHPAGNAEQVEELALNVEQMMRPTLPPPSPPLRAGMLISISDSIHLIKKYLNSTRTFC